MNLNNRRPNIPTYKQVDNTKPFPRQLKSDMYGYYRCTYCHKDSNSPKSKFIWVEDAERNYREHYLCGSCVDKWEKSREANN